MKKSIITYVVVIALIAGYVLTHTYTSNKVLDEMLKDNKIKQGDKLVLSAFGAGFCTAACLIEW